MRAHQPFPYTGHISCSVPLHLAEINLESQRKLNTDTFYLSFSLGGQSCWSWHVRCREVLTGVCQLSPQAVRAVAVPRDLRERLPQGAEGLESCREPGRKTTSCERLGEAHWQQQQSIWASLPDLYGKDVCPAQSHCAILRSARVSQTLTWPKSTIP